MSEVARVPSVENRILRALPASEYERLLPNLKSVHLPKGKILFNAGDALSHAYFISDGMISMLSTTQEGLSLEIATIGNEGLVGIPLILKSNHTPYQLLVQAEVGNALKISASVLKQEFSRNEKLQDHLLEYTRLLIFQISQSSICYRFHTIEKRLARWLLTVHDRSRSDIFSYTQELISHLLGSPRTHITKAAVLFQREDLIRYSRGEIKILDREGLASMSCECYEILKKEFERFLTTEQRSSSSAAR